MYSPVSSPLRFNCAIPDGGIRISGSENQPGEKRGKISKSPVVFSRLRNTQDAISFRALTVPQVFPGLFQFRRWRAPVRTLLVERVCEVRFLVLHNLQCWGWVWVSEKTHTHTHNIFFSPCLCDVQGSQNVKGRGRLTVSGSLHEACL